ncbi:MAG: hypothetical protein ACI88Z_001111, partial [Sphingobacteriales bacterium]
LARGTGISTLLKKNPKIGTLSNSYFPINNTLCPVTSAMVGMSKKLKWFGQKITGVVGI